MSRVVHHVCWIYLVEYGPDSLWNVPCGSYGDDFEALVAALRENDSLNVQVQNVSRIGDSTDVIADQYWIAGRMFLDIFDTEEKLWAACPPGYAREAAEREA